MFQNKSKEIKQGEVIAVVFWSMFNSQLWFLALVTANTPIMSNFKLPSHVIRFTKFPENLITGLETRWL